MIFDMTQYSPEWWEARRGLITASGASKIITPKTGKLSASAQDYALEIIAEMYTPNLDLQGPVTAAMALGTAREPAARAFYSMLHETDVREVGGILSECGRLWASPDGLTEEGGLEIKCPGIKSHLEYLCGPADFEAAYRPQVHAALLASGLPFWDLMSYCPEFEPKPYLIIRVEPDGYTQKLLALIDEFWGIYTDACNRLGVPPKETNGQPP